MSQFDHLPLELSPGLAALRRVLTETPPHVLLGDDAHDGQPLRQVARTLASDARSHDAVRAERLLIELRRIWRELPEARLFDQRTHEQLWNRLVTACVEEFYSPANSPR